MAFCKFSSDMVAKSFTLVDNAFFAKVLPFTPPKLCSIYLFGLYQCSNNNDSFQNSSLNAFAECSGFSVDEVKEAFEYWQEQGAVRIVCNEPLQVQYLSLSNFGHFNRKYDKDKYSQFNLEAQNLISERMLTPNEYEEYYTLIEGFALPDGKKFTPEALLMIIKYCTEFKGKNVNYRYIIAVAKDWAIDGYISAERIEQRLKEYSDNAKSVTKIIKALGSSKKPTLEDFQLCDKWLKGFGFTLDTICYVASLIKKNSNANMDKLNKRLQKYYEIHLFSEIEISQFEDNKDKLYGLAREINKALGVYYEDVSNQIETYLTPWLTKGYTNSILLTIAQDCFKTDKRTLRMMDEHINKLFDKGIVTEQAYEQFNKNKNAIDIKIQEVLSKCNLKRNVNNIDREFWNRWTITWNMPYDVIQFVAELSQDKTTPIAYLNKVLSNFHNQGITKVVDAKKSLLTTTSNNKDTLLRARDYSAEFDNITKNFNEIEL